MIPTLVAIKEPKVQKEGGRELLFQGEYQPHNQCEGETKDLNPNPVISQLHQHSFITIFRRK